MKPKSYQLVRRAVGRKQYYQLLVDRVVVSTCYLEYMGGVYWRLYAVVTLPTYRRQGYAYHMLYRVLRAYRMRGMIVALTSTPCAERLYESLGFIRTSITWPEYQIKL